MSEELEAVEVEAVPEAALVVSNAYANTPAMRVSEAVERFQALREFVSKLMRKDVDYGIIPGTGKKATLLKPGAEKLCTFFGLRAEFVEQNCVRDFEKGLFYFEYKCRLWRGDHPVGESVGSCNSFEKKYRYRKAERKCPSCGVAAIIKGKAEYGGGWLCFGKKGGCGAKFTDGEDSIEKQDGADVVNPDPSENINTIQKMAQKRALVAATLVTVNASEFFTQGLEDMPHDDPAPEERPAARQTKRAARQAPITVEDGSDAGETFAAPAGARQASKAVMVLGLPIFLPWEVVKTQMIGSNCAKYGSGVPSSKEVPMKTWGWAADGSAGGEREVWLGELFERARSIHAQGEVLPGNLQAAVLALSQMRESNKGATAPVTAEEV